MDLTELQETETLALSTAAAAKHSAPYQKCAPRRPCSLSFWNYRHPETMHRLPPGRRHTRAKTREGWRAAVARASTLRLSSSSTNEYLLRNAPFSPSLKRIYPPTWDAQPRQPAPAVAHAHVGVQSRRRPAIIETSLYTVLSWSVLKRFVSKQKKRGRRKVCTGKSGGPGRPKGRRRGAAGGGRLQPPKERISGQALFAAGYRTS